MRVPKFVTHLLIATCLLGGVALGEQPYTDHSARALPSKHQAWSDAVSLLEKTKKQLQADPAPDVNGHKARALTFIMKAMEELRAVTQGEKH